MNICAQTTHPPSIEFRRLGKANDAKPGQGRMAIAPDETRCQQPVYLVNQIRAQQGRPEYAAPLHEQSGEPGIRQGPQASGQVERTRGAGQVEQFGARRFQSAPALAPLRVKTRVRLPSPPA